MAGSDNDTRKGTVLSIDAASKRFGRSQKIKRILVRVSISLDDIAANRGDIAAVTALTALRIRSLSLRLVDKLAPLGDEQGRLVRAEINELREFYRWVETRQQKSSDKTAKTSLKNVKSRTIGRSALTQTPTQVKRAAKTGQFVSASKGKGKKGSGGTGSGGPGVKSG